MKSLEEKQKEVEGLVTLIELNNRPLTRAEKEQTEAIEYGLQTRLDSLMNRFKHEEIDLRIGAMKEILQIVKTTT